MIIISHRGNLEYPNFSMENSPKQVDKVIHTTSFDVEIDVWLKGDQWYLGHDSPVFKIDIDWMYSRRSRLWVHCKNTEALLELNESTDYVNYFVHDKDFATLTSHNVIWGYPGQKIKGSIFVLPELNNDELDGCLGICTDFPLKYEKDQNLHSDV